MEQLKKQISQLLDKDIKRFEFFLQGQIGEIYRLETADKKYILKTSNPSNRLKIEANMLEDINKYNISVPEVYKVTNSYLLMEYIARDNVSKSTQEEEAAKVLATLHSVSNESRMYGYYYDTSIGPFNQKNEQTQYNWALFLAQMRMMPMARVCYDKAEISKELLVKLEGLSNELYKRIDISTIKPSLIHGDLWSGNILFNHSGATLIDPAIYFADKEMELAFILLFNTFGDTFFSTYNEIYPLSDDFYETKVFLYQIYPLLVHIALYGSSYVSSLENILKRLKC